MVDGGRKRGSSGHRPLLAVLRSPGAWHDTLPRRAVSRAARCDVIELRIDRNLADRLRSLKPDVVRIDLDNSRFELARLCASVRHECDGWIIVTSSRPLEDRIVTMALGAGADDVVAENAGGPSMSGSEWVFVGVASTRTSRRVFSSATSWSTSLLMSCASQVRRCHVRQFRTSCWSR